MPPVISPACASRASSTCGSPASAAARGCATGGAGDATAMRREGKRPMTMRSGPAAWARREQRAGDRLPYASHVDDGTILLRNGALMRSIHIAGLPFETEESEQLDHMLQVREVMLRSMLDARLV